jgi:hypothetical protein
LMADEETLHAVREAFDLVRRDEGGLGGWGLDDGFLSPFTQSPDSPALTINLLRGESERKSIDIDPAAVARCEGGATVANLADEIRRALRVRGILAD